MRARFPYIVVGAVATLALSACGSSSSTSSSPAPSGTSTSPQASYQKTVSELLSGSSYGRPPSTAPTPAKGKTIWVLSCGQALSGCARAAAAMQAAASHLGWQTHLYDTKGDVSQYPVAVRAAIAAHADGIVSYTFDCGLVKETLVEAKAAHIPFVGAEAVDCNPPLNTSIVTYQVGTFPAFFAATGRALVPLAQAGTHGSPKVIYLKETDLPDVAFENQGFEQAMASCSTCKIVDTVEWTLADFSGNRLAEKVQQALAQHPEANSLMAPYDDVLDLGAVAGIRAAGREGSTYVVSTVGGNTVNKLLLAGGIHFAGIGIPQAWEGWAAIDGLVRAFAGQKAVNSGIGIQAYDATHNLDSSGLFKPPVNFEAAYLKAWGVK